MDDTKVCTKCGETKSAEDFYVKDKRTGRRFTRCKVCHQATTLAASIRRRRGDEPPRRSWHQQRLQQGGFKPCGRCGEVLALDQFPIKDQKTGTRRSRCLPCHNAANLEHKRANKEKVAEQRLAYYAANRDRILASQRQYREEHPEVDRATHAKWKSANKDLVNAATHRRRNKIVVNGGHWTAEEWQALKASFDHRCLFCWRQEPEIVLTFDHVVPVHLGGSNDISNGQPLCKPCNSRKHTQPLDLRPAARDRLATERFMTD